MHCQQKNNKKMDISDREFNEIAKDLNRYVSRGKAVYMLKEMAKYMQVGGICRLTGITYQGYNRIIKAKKNTKLRKYNAYMIKSLYKQYRKLVNNITDKRDTVNKFKAVSRRAHKNK